MNKTCAGCRTPFQIYPEDLEFYGKISPIFNGAAYAVPEPRLCPDCRLQRRCMWRNEFKYYRRECQRCSARSISVHSPDKRYPVYCNRCWWNDDWDPRAYGSEFDHAASFFAQYKLLQQSCPKPFLANDNHTVSENIEYCQGVAYSKNCYLATTSWRLEDCLYCSNCGESRSLVDCRFVGDGSELVYESATCQRVYSCSHLYGCSGCSNCHLGIDLRGCSDCIACIGLRNQKHCIFNRQYSPQDFAAEALKLNLGSYAARKKLLEEFDRFAKSQPQRGVIKINCERASGNNIFNCKNFLGFNVFGGEDSKYYIIGTRPKNCYDILVGGEHEWCYEGVNPDHSYLSHFTVWCWSCTDTHYSDNCHASKNLFGCIGLRRAEYCILNRQYTKEEYNLLVPQIIESMRIRGEWGEFFPPSVSPFAYNETIAQDYFPMSMEQAAGRGLAWAVEENRGTHQKHAVLPDQIEDVVDSVLNEVLACKSCNKNYKLMPIELGFHRRQNIPLPRNCPDCRRKARFARSGLFKVWNIPCAECGVLTESATDLSARAHILCEKCYDLQF